MRISRSALVAVLLCVPGPATGGIAQAEPAEPEESWIGTMAYDKGSGATVATFTLQVTPGGAVDGHGNGEWTGLGTMDPMELDITGARTAGTLDLSIHGYGPDGDWRLDHVFAVHGAVAHESLNEDVSPPAYPQWHVDLKCEDC